MNFTDNPFERMMKQVPKSPRPEASKPPKNSPCRGCCYWNGTACIGTCYRDLIIKTSGQLGPKLGGKE